MKVIKLERESELIVIYGISNFAGKSLIPDDLFTSMLLTCSVALNFRNTDHVARFQTVLPKRSHEFHQSLI